MNCIFCDIVNEKAKSWTVYKDKYITAFLDYNPASKWHMLIVPNEHYSNLSEVPDDILWRITILSKKIFLLYKKNFWIHNINIIQSNWESAWQEVFHHHTHVVPRRENDNITFYWDIDVNIRNEFDELKNSIKKGLNEIVS